jgi:hypothetical protein
MISISPKQAPEAIMDVLSAGLVPMLTSSPGMGKSSIIKQVADSQGLKVIDLRLSQADPTDLNGFPKILDCGTKAGYVPMDTFPVEGDEVPDGYNGWLLFLDEMNSAPLSVQAAAYKLVLDKEVGQQKLHSKVVCVAAGNKKGDGAIVNRMGTAMRSRVIHLQMDLDYKAWLDWAAGAGIDFRITSWINFKPDALHMFNPDHDDCTFPCPRTWEFLSLIAKPWKTMSSSKLAVVAGTVGEGMAREFMTFCSIFKELPTIAQLLAKPELVAISEEPSTRYALSGLISNHIDADNAGTLMKVINRLPVEFQVITLQSAMKRDRSLVSVAEVRTWIQASAAKLM